MLHAVPQLAKLGGNLVDELLGRAAGSVGRALDLLPVLVGAGEEPGVHAHHALAARDGIAHDGGVGVADVRPRVDVVDGRGDVELSGVIHSSGPGTSESLPASPSSAERDARWQCGGNLHTRARTADIVPFSAGDLDADFAPRRGDCFVAARQHVTLFAAHAHAQRAALAKQSARAASLRLAAGQNRQQRARTALLHLHRRGEDVERACGKRRSMM